MTLSSMSLTSIEFNRFFLIGFNFLLILDLVSNCNSFYFLTINFFGESFFLFVSLPNPALVWLDLFSLFHLINNFDPFPHKESLIYSFITNFFLHFNDIILKLIYLGSHSSNPVVWSVLLVISAILLLV